MIERLRASRSSLTMLVALLAFAGMLSASPALAADEHPYLPDESHLEAFEEPCGATTDSYGNLYVAEPLEGTVKVYDPAGVFLTELLPGEVSALYPCSMAVDRTGAVYLAGYGIPSEMKVAKFVPEGGEFPPTASTEYVLDESAGDEGVIVDEGAESVAVDPEAGDVYVAEEGTNEVQRLLVPPVAQCPAPDKKVVFAWTPTGEVGTTEVACGASEGPIRSALEDLLGPDTVEVLSPEKMPNNYRVRFTGELGNTDFPVGVLETREVGSGTVLSTSTAHPSINGAPSQISIYEPDGTPVPGAIGTGVSAAAFYGVDIDASTGRVYAVDTQNVLVDVFDPSVSKGTPIATIDGSANPNFPDGFGDLFQGFLTVDQTTGNFFVSNIGVSFFAHPNEGNGVIAQFTSAGEFVSQVGPTFGEDELEFETEISSPIGLAVDDGLCSPNRGNVYVAANWENVYTFGPTSPFTPVAPAVTAVDPPQGPTAGGGTVTVTGTELGCADLPGGEVEFGGTAATDIDVNATGTELTATAPAHAAGSVDVTVTTSNGSSTSTAADEYTYLAIPTVASLSPDQGPSSGGNVVTVVGTELSGADEPGGSVEFDGVPATAVSVNDAGTQLTATVPAHAAEPVDVTVTTPGGTSATGSPSEYTYVNAPTLIGCTPAAGPLSGGPQVSCTGTNLTGASFAFGAGNMATGVTVSGDGTGATMSPPSAPGAAPGVVAIAATTPGGTAAQTIQYTYVAAPAVTGVSPDRGPLEARTAVTVTGTGLAGADEPAGAVKFGVVPATDVDVNPAGTELTAFAPAGAAGTVHVTVTMIGGTSATSAEDEYTYVSPPALTVIKAGTGTGSVKCNDGPCEAAYAYGSSVTLEATAAAGSTFGGWSGACTGTGKCVVTVNADTAVTATFDAVPQKKDEGVQAPPPPSSEAGTAEVAPTATVKAGKAPLSVSCPGPGACKGTIKLTAKVKIGKKTKTIVVGSASYDIAAGQSATVEVALSRKAWKLLKKGSLKVRASGPGIDGTLRLKRLPPSGKKR